MISDDIVDDIGPLVDIGVAPTEGGGGIIEEDDIVGAINYNHQWQSTALSPRDCPDCPLCSVQYTFNKWFTKYCLVLKFFPHIAHRLPFLRDLVHVNNMLLEICYIAISAPAPFAFWFCLHQSSVTSTEGTRHCWSDQWLSTALSAWNCPDFPLCCMWCTFNKWFIRYCLVLKIFPHIVHNSHCSAIECTLVICCLRFVILL